MTCEKFVTAFADAVEFQITVIVIAAVVIVGWRVAAALLKRDDE